VEVNFNILTIKVNGIESSAAMNVGTNLLIGFGSSTKSIQGSGQVNGDNSEMPSRLNIIDDRDEVDTPNWEVGPGGILRIAPFRREE
jgi:hypothetical protein